MLYCYKKFHNEVVCTSENIGNIEGFPRKKVSVFTRVNSHKCPLSRKPFNYYSFKTFRQFKLAHAFC